MYPFYRNRWFHIIEYYNDNIKCIVLFGTQCKLNKILLCLIRIYLRARIAHKYEVYKRTKLIFTFTTELITFYLPNEVGGVRFQIKNNNIFNVMNTTRL